MLTPAELSRLEAVELQTQRLLLATQSVQAGFRNRANIQSANPTAVTAGMTLNYAAVLLQAQSSGLFLVNVAWQYTNATAAVSNTIGMTTQTNAAPIALTNTTVAGGGFISSAAGGILVTGGPFNSFSATALSFTTATGQTTGLYSWSGIAQTVGPAAFPKGNFCAFLFNVNGGTSSWTITGVTIEVIELMA